MNQFTARRPNALAQARAAILAGQNVPATLAAQLEARGISVADLEQRLRA